MSNKIHFNAQSIIDEWYTMPETEQFKMLVKCIKYNIKHHKDSFTFSRDDIDEAVSETWLYLQPKLTTQYIENANRVFLKAKGKCISLAVIVCRAANVASVTLTRAKRRQVNQSNVSLNAMMQGKAEIEDNTFIENISRYSESIESSIINILALEWLINRHTGLKAKIIKDLVRGYTQSEIAKNNNISRQYVSQCVGDIRKAFCSQFISA